MIFLMTTAVGDKMAKMLLGPSIWPPLLGVRLCLPSLDLGLLRDTDVVASPPYKMGGNALYPLHAYYYGKQWLKSC